MKELVTDYLDGKKDSKASQADESRRGLKDAAHGQKLSLAGSGGREVGSPVKARSSAGW
jgi:hypothetical protein